MLSTAVRRLVNLYAVRPGTRAVVLTANAEGDAAAADLAPRRGRGRARRRRPPGRDDRAGAPARAGSRPSSSTDGTVAGRPARDGHRLDGADVPAEHGRRPAGLRPRRRRGSCPAARACRRRSWPPAGSSATALPTSSSSTAARGRRAGRRRRPHGGRPPTGSDVPAAAAHRVPHPAIASRAVPVRTHGFVDFSEDVSSKDICRRPRRATTPVELRQALHDRHHGPVPGQARDGQHGGRARPRPPGATIAETRHDHVAAAVRARSRSARWPVASSSRPGCRRCSRGTRRHGAVAAASPDSGSVPTTTATRSPRSATSASSVGIIDVTPIGKLDLRGPDVAEAAQPALRQQVVAARRRSRPLRRHVRRGRRRASTTASPAGSARTTT